MEVTHTVLFKAVAVTAQQDLFEVKNGTNATCRIHGFILSQETEFGDAAEEELRLIMLRMSAGTSGSGGTVAVAPPRRRGDPAFTGVIRVNDTTRMQATPSPDLMETLEVHTWNIRVPYIFWYPPEARPVILGSEYWALALEDTPLDSITMSGTLYLEQV